MLIHVRERGSERDIDVREKQDWLPPVCALTGDSKDPKPFQYRGQLSNRLSHTSQGIYFLSC